MNEVGATERPKYEDVSKLSQDFKRELWNKHKLTIELLISQGWRYVGDWAHHHDYFLRIQKIWVGPHPEKEDECICNVEIVHNNYISNGDKILVIGRCCMEHFLPKGMSGRTCDLCAKPHKNTKDNKCNECRLLCGCGDKVEKKSDFCHWCGIENECMKILNQYKIDHIKHTVLCKCIVCK